MTSSSQILTSYAGRFRECLNSVWTGTWRIAPRGMGILPMNHHGRDARCYVARFRLSDDLAVSTSFSIRGSTSQIGCVTIHAMPTPETPAQFVAKWSRTSLSERADELPWQGPTTGQRRSARPFRRGVQWISPHP